MENKIFYFLLILLFIFLVIKIKNLNKDTFGKFYNGDKWNDYRLGDVYLRADDPDVVQDLSYHLTRYPGRIAAEIIKVKPYIRQNKNLLLTILESKQKYNISDNELVLHIRTGDAMCIENKRFEWYSKINDTAWWNKVLEYIKNNGITKVYIVSGTHKNECITESIKYINDRKKFLEDNKILVELRLGNDPDDDFIFCLSAKHFISTGGGFGRIIYEINNNWFN